MIRRRAVQHDTLSPASHGLSRVRSRPPKAGKAVLPTITKQRAATEGCCRSGLCQRKRPTDHCSAFAHVLPAPPTLQSIAQASGSSCATKLGMLTTASWPRAVTSLVPQMSQSERGWSLQAMYWTRLLPWVYETLGDQASPASCNYTCAYDKLSLAAASCRSSCARLPRTFARSGSLPPCCL